jgi:hypothetical protein
LIERKEAGVNSVKRWPIIVAAGAGLIVGLLCVVCVGAAVNMGTSLSRTTTVIMLILCPFIYAIWWNFWLVLVLNAALYGGITFGVMKWRLGTDC